MMARGIKNDKAMDLPLWQCHNLRTAAKDMLHFGLWQSQ
jgi:hypothetical protein